MWTKVRHGWKTKSVLGWNNNDFTERRSEFEVEIENLYISNVTSEVTARYTVKGCNMKYDYLAKGLWRNT